jgi:glutamate synthase domain-containing protein 2
LPRRRTLHRLAFGDNPLLADALDTGGEYQYRIRGEDHAWTPDSVAKLQHAARSGSFATYANMRRSSTTSRSGCSRLRGLFELKFAHVPIPLEDVEPARRSSSALRPGAMSLGSISTEAHTTLAVAMNRIGGKSNTGEGGEDARRYPLEKKGETLRSRIDTAVVDIALKEGDSLRSKIKQVASARFGVTAEYLVNADQLQIKMAQGAKPAKAGSCRATRFPSTSRSCASRSRESASFRPPPTTTSIRSRISRN